MEKFIPTFVDITEWNKNPYSSTGGTRAKKIYIQPESEISYFFKGSKELEDGDIRYPLEFWSEIASSKIGQYLGFDILDYNIGFDAKAKQPLGCLSKTMILHPENTLTEGIDYLRGYDSRYNPSKDEQRYTFSFIKDTLAYFNLSDFEEHFIDMLVFDSIIGNSDRHQENWGFITKYKETIAKIEEEIAESNGWRRRIILRGKKFITTGILASRWNEINQNKRSKRATLLNQSLLAQTEFSPIYDSGCCLGRELDDTKIQSMLQNQNEIETYVNKGKSEVRWSNGKKQKHFDVISKLQIDYPNQVSKLKKRIEERYNFEELKALINDLDSMLLEELKDHNLPIIRKELMIKIVDLRIKRFLELK